MKGWVWPVHVRSTVFIGSGTKEGFAMTCFSCVWQFTYNHTACATIKVYVLGGWGR